MKVLEGIKQSISKNTTVYIKFAPSVRVLIFKCINKPLGDVVQLYKL